MGEGTNEEEGTKKRKKRSIITIDLWEVISRIFFPSQDFFLWAIFFLWDRQLPVRLIVDTTTLDRDELP